MLSCYFPLFIPILVVQDAMEFAQRHGIKPTTVVFEGVEKAPEAYAAMRKGEYRVVIKM